jgi:ATP-dependent RNA circularization protein (DNA/RNA ligase family)
MKAEEFQEKLAAAGDDARFAGGVTKYQHVERLGSENVEGLLDGFPLVVQEKIDGANLSVWMEDGQLCIASRNKQLCGPGGWAEEGDGSEFRGAVGYIRAHRGIAAFLAEFPDRTLRGEWLVKHTVVYSPEAWNKFYVFDVQSKDGEYVPSWAYSSILQGYGIDMVPFIEAWTDDTGPLTLEHLAELAGQPSALGAPKREGVVVKRYDFINRFGRIQWGKVVNADFAEAHKTEQCTEKDPSEIRFVARCVTDDLIRKTIGKIEDRQGGHFETKNISELLGRVWFDAFTEELWTFVKNERVGAFDFKAANRLAIRKVRDFALAYCGGSL